MQPGVRLFSCLGDLGASMQARHDPLEGNAVERRVLEHEGPEHGNADRHQISNRVIGLDQLVDPVSEELERTLSERVDDQPLLGSEQAVHGAGCGARLRGHGAH